MSYYPTPSRFTPLELEQTRLAMTAALDVAHTAGLRPSRGARTFHLEPGEFDHRLRTAILRAVYLGLKESKGLKVADLGCGPGHFIAAARFFGHDCIGYDLPQSSLTPATARAYDSCLRALRSSREDLVIRPFQPLDLPETFDLITAGLICFNEYPSGATWSRKEWEYFVQDACRYLRPGGRLFLELNEHAEFGRLRWFDEPTMNYFAEIGEVRRNKVTITPPATSRVDASVRPEQPSVLEPMTK